MDATDGPVGEAAGPVGDDLDRRFEALHRRFLDLADRVQREVRDEASARLLAEVLEEFSAAVEELEVSTEEIHAQNEALELSQTRIEAEARRYRELFDGAPDGYLVTDERGVITESNRAASELLGTQLPFLLSKPLIVFVRQDQRRLMLRALHEVLSGTRTRGTELEVDVTPLGSRTGFPVSVTIVASPPRPGERRTVRWLVRDVTRRVAAEEALALQEQRYRLIAASVSDVVLTADAEGRIAYASPSSQNVFGKRASELEGREVSELIHPDDWLTLAGLEERARRGAAHAAGMLRSVAGGGRTRSTDVGVVAMRDDSGSPTGLCYTFRDANEREKSRLALHAALARERQAASALRDADAAKDALLLAASHDLSSPVAAIAGLAGLLVEHPDLPQGELRRMAEGLAEAGSQLRSILTNLLDAERVLGSHVVVQRRPADLHGIVVTAVRQHGLPAACVRPIRGPVLADIDPGLTARIVDNIVANALRHTAAGTPVRVTLDEGDGEVVLSVADRGPGIPDGIKESVFEPFQRHGSQPGGLGLGLFVVRRFAELQGGRAWVEDTEGGGATVRVVLTSAEGPG